jgi:GntR family transcriptional regulator
MRFALNPSAGQPLYLQLILQIRHAIEIGVLQPGETLPGVRVLAQELVVSPNTVVKAYAELEREGLIDNRPGSGAYVLARPGMRPRGDRLRGARERVRALIARLQADGLSDEEVQRLFEAELLFPAPAPTNRRP